MKYKVLIAFAILMGSMMAMSQTKVLERSSKKTPAWLGVALDDYLVVSVTAPTMAEAQSKALSEISERIIRAVASNVSVSTTNQMQEVYTNGEVLSKDDFRQISKMNSAKLPFIKDISLSNAEDIYWERVQNKNTKLESYNYSVKYPFSQSRKQQLIDQFTELDAKYDAELESLTAEIDNLEAVEDIKENISRLDVLEAYFFDEVRLAKVVALKNRYRQLYGMLAIVGEFVSPDSYQCGMLLSGMPVKVSAMPKVSTNCAIIQSVVPQEGKFLISYDATDCLPDEMNELVIAFRINGKKMEHKAYLNDAATTGAEKFSVIPEGKLILMADSVDVEGRKVFDIKVRLTLNNRGTTPFGLKSLELNIPEISAPIVFDNIDSVYETNGITEVEALAQGAFSILSEKKSALPFVKGSVTLINPLTGALERQRLSLPYITNW